MSTIEEVKIQGIRNFKENIQLIEFSSPVTLILGDNGCGKTTIIECLKYALTGDAPPGSKNGQRFVNNRKEEGLSDSWGNIELRVSNIKNEERTVSRTLHLSYKDDKPTFEATSTISIGDEPVTKKNKYVDLNMSQFMGVSKAIINNVIFCHQEDSSWPLDEPKKLKEKFDAIFGTIEHNKAIGKFLQIQKDQTDKLKEKEGKLKGHSKLVEDMKNKKTELEKEKLRNGSIEKECADLDVKMEAINGRLREIQEVEYTVKQEKTNKIKLELKIETLRDQISKQKKTIKEPSEESIEQLNLKIKCFSDQIKEKKSKKEELDKTLGSLQNEEKNIEKIILEKDNERRSIDEQRQREQKKNAERAKKMHELCEKLNISVNDPNSSDRIDKSLQKEEENIKDQQKAHDNAEDEKQKHIDVLREKKARFESDIKSKQEKKKQCKIDLQKTVKKIIDAPQSFKQLNDEVNLITERLRSEASNQKDFESQIAEKKKNVERLNEELKTLDNQLTFLNSISKLMAEIHSNEEQLKRKEQEERRIKAKHNENLRKVSDSPVEAKFNETVQKISDELQCQWKELIEEINNLKVEERSLKIKETKINDKLTNWEKDLDEKKNKINEQCCSTPYEEKLAKSNEHLSKYQLNLGALKSSEAMYKRYIKNIEDEPSCPLCHNTMCESDASSLAAELKKQIQRLPDDIKRSEDLLKAEQENYESLISLRPLIEVVERLERVIPTRKTELMKLKTNISKITSKVEDCQMLQIELSTKVELANSMIGDMSLLDEALKDVKRLNAILEELKKKLPENSNASIDNVQLERDNVSVELEHERKTLNTIYELQQKMNKHQSLSQLKKREDELSEQIKTIDMETAELEKGLKSLTKDLDDSVEEKHVLKDGNRNIISTKQANLNSLKSLNDDIKRLDKESINMAQPNLSEQIEHIERSIQFYTEKLDLKSNEITKRKKDLKQLEDDIKNQESEKNNLEKNHELKELDEEVEKLEAEKEKAFEKLRKLNFDEISREMDKLSNKHDQLKTEKNKRQGQRDEINNQIKKLQSETDETKYTKCKQDYHKSSCEVEIIKNTIDDLGQYINALEWALIKFHSDKMNKINHMIREYWRQIYRGNDIDHIQIKAEKAEQKSTDKRRIYNYYVMQSKNNEEIEMRGSCSAGQRVLASLIIRMVLAEIFSCNCGIIALDEPTTNLDKTNIKSLCETLNRIVKERQNQHNFMFIIITHDKEFISLLDDVEYYHRVSRNEHGNSMIEKVRMS